MLTLEWKTALCLAPNKSWEHFCVLKDENNWEILNIFNICNLKTMEAVHFPSVSGWHFPAEARHCKEIQDSASITEQLSRRHLVRADKQSQLLPKGCREAGVQQNQLHLYIYLICKANQPKPCSWCRHLQLSCSSDAGQPLTLHVQPEGVCSYYWTNTTYVLWLLIVVSFNPQLHLKNTNVNF